MGYLIVMILFVVLALLALRYIAILLDGVDTDSIGIRMVSAMEFIWRLRMSTTIANAALGL
jgi:hypothetical protein